MDFVIIGAQKSGTTFLARCLSDHPRIFLPSQEVPFFQSPDYETGSLDQFRKNFIQAPPGAILGIKRADYLGQAECAENIYRHYPQAKLVAILRNPVERLISAYHHYALGSFCPAVPYDEGIESLLRGALKERWPRSQELLDYGAYGKNLEPYINRFGRSKILVLLYDDLVADPAKLIDHACEFLGVTPELSKPRLQTKPQATINSMRRIRLLALRNRFTHDYNERRTRSFPKSRLGILEKSLVRAIESMDKILYKHDKAQKPELSPELKRKLLDYYKSDLRKLASLTGIDTRPWQK